MEEIQKKLKQFGDKKNIEALQNFVESLTTDELTSFTTEYISRVNSIPLWKYLLQSFTDSPESHEKRIQVTLLILRAIEENNVPNNVRNAVVVQLRSKFSNFKTAHLIDVCDLCIESIQKGKTVHNSWKDLLPQILLILSEKQFLMYNNTEMAGSEFKKQVLNSLCMINWSANIVTSLAAMFREIQLGKEEHLQVVTKLCQSMDKLTSQEVPAFTYQLLKLCFHQNSRCIFLKLQHYFTKRRIYNNLLTENSESSTDNTDEISDASELEALQAESTVLYHIHNSATLCPGSIKEYVNSLRTLLKAPEFILYPFQLNVLLMISTAQFFKEQAVEIIRSSIARTVTEEAKKAESAWFRTILTSSNQTTNIISAIIENSVKERPLVVAGLINLAFSLLNVGAGLGSKNIAEAQWQLGSFILRKLVKRKDDVASTVVQQLCNRIVTDQNISHLTDCLQQMCKNLTLTMRENEGIIIQMIEQIFQVPASNSKSMIGAVVPLAKVSSTLRDNIVLILRKALNSAKTEMRQTAVYGFVELMKHLRIWNVNALTLSQPSSSSSNFSFLTQLTLDSHLQQPATKFSNEALCLEVLGCLRKCFMQQAEIRGELYQGLYDVVYMNSELGMPILDLLWIHFSDFYNHENPDALPPLNFDKIVVTRNVDVVLLEPLGHLIFVTGLITIKLKETHEQNDPNIAKFSEVLLLLCDQMAKCELVHFGLDNGRDLLDSLPECQTDLHNLKQAMSVYEALIGYLIASWSSTSENIAQKMYALFQAYSRLVDFSKNLSKPKKAEGRKKTKDDTGNKTASVKPSKTFKPANTVLDFPTAGKILSLLHEPTVSWASISQTSHLKGKCEFHRFILQTVIQQLQNVKISKCMEAFHTKPYFRYCTEIATVLYGRVLKRLEHVLEFDCSTTVLAAECFQLILNLITTYYKEKLRAFVRALEPKNQEEDVGALLISVIEVFQKYFELEEDEYSDDPEGKKLPGFLVSSYSILVNNLPPNSIHITQVLDWLKKYTNENSPSNKQIANALTSLLLNLNLRCKASSDLYEHIALRLCEITGTIDQAKSECPVPLKILNEASALPTLNVLLNTLKTMLNEADWLIARFRAEYSMISHPGGENIERRRESLKNKERDLCCHICQVAKVCVLISNMAVPPGMHTEAIFKILIHLYNTLNSLTKYFTLISTKLNPAFQSARFERVLKLSGKPLMNKVYSFFLYVEQSQQPDEDSDQKKKSANPSTLKTKVLRETRLIPKVVYELEQFGRNVIALSNRTKVDVSKFVGLGTARDFRIMEPALKDALEKIPHGLDDTDVDIADNTGTETSLNEESHVEEQSMEVDEQEEEDTESENDTPPKKKTKK